MFLEENTCIVVKTSKGKWDIVDKYGFDRKNFLIICSKMFIPLSNFMAECYCGKENIICYFFYIVSIGDVFCEV
jgi:hypothetical protein